MSRVARVSVIVLSVLMVAAAVSGCAKKQQEPAALQPKIAPPAIGEPGVLRAGVDFSTPPFAGEDAGRQAGLDIDVAAALAERLGLKLQIAEVKPDKAAEALKADQVDVVMSVPLSEKALAGTTLGGTYIEDGPVLFAKTDASATVEPTLGVKDLDGRKVAVQKNSAAYWTLSEQFGPDALIVKPTLRDAFDAAKKGEAEFVAGDAIVGSYLARDFEGYQIVGTVSPATLLGVAVLPDNSELADAVRGSLDTLSADGVLDAIRGKWVGKMPKLPQSTVATTSP